MGKILSTVGVAGGLFVGACNTCAGRTEPPASEEPPPPTVSTMDEPELVDENEGFSLPKHDWNGLRVMTTEGQVRSTLKKIGFNIKLSRNKTFLTYDTMRQVVHVWKKDEDLASMVFMETNRRERVLKNVWGVRLVFVKNRLIQFSPQYFTSPVELVEPDDEYVPVRDMERKLRETFGTNGILDGEIEVVYPDERGKIREKVIVWSDGSLIIIFRKVNDSGIEGYSLVFTSPGGIKTVEKSLSRSLKLKKKKSELEAINF